MPSTVRRAWQVLRLEGIVSGVEEGVADKVVRLAGYLQPPDVPETYMPVFNNFDFVVFDVAEWVPLLGADGMVETEPEDSESRVALLIYRGALVYANTRKLPRGGGYPDGLPSHDLNQPKARQV